MCLCSQNSLQSQVGRFFNGEVHSGGGEEEKSISAVKFTWTDVQIFLNGSTASKVKNVTFAIQDMYLTCSFSIVGITILRDKEEDWNKFQNMLGHV